MCYIKLTKTKKDKKTNLLKIPSIFEYFQTFVQRLLFFETHCMKSVRILSFFWAVFSRIRTKYGKTPNMDSIHAVALCRLDDIWKNTLEALILKAKLLGRSDIQTSNFGKFCTKQNSKKNISKNFSCSFNLKNSNSQVKLQSFQYVYFWHFYNMAGLLKVNPTYFEKMATA